MRHMHAITRAKECHITFCTLLYPPHITCRPGNKHEQHTPIPDHTALYTGINQEIANIVREHQLGRPMSLTQVGFTNKGYVKEAHYAGVRRAKQPAKFSHLTKLTQLALKDWSFHVSKYADTLISSR